MGLLFCYCVIVPRRFCSSGPAGTGKTRACLEKLHLCAEKYPGMRGLIVRKTRASLTESALVTFENHVVPEGHPCLEGPTRAHRQSYRYPNGSELVCGGMDRASRTLSTEYDIVYVPEAIELTEDDWELLTRPLRHGKMPYQQIIADTNPDKPGHWLKQRCDAGRTKILESRHEDNPTVTPAYIAKLDALTGPRKQRLRYGRWVQAEGVVYEGWDAALHVVDPFVIPADWPRWWAIDFGFTHPFVCLWLAQDPDGRLFVYRELHQTQLLVEDAAQEILALSAQEPRPRAIICDHDAEGRATLTRHLGMDTEKAIKDVSAGIQAVAVRLRKASDGRPRLFVLRDSLVCRDPRLEEQKKPCCLAEEVDGYVWKISGDRIKGEEPVKENDDALDALRYAVMEVDRPAPLMDIIQIKLRPDGLPRYPPSPKVNYPDCMRWFTPNKSWQPWIDREDSARLWLPDFRTEDQAAYALNFCRRLLGMEAVTFAREPDLSIRPDGFEDDPVKVATEIEKRVREFLRGQRVSVVIEAKSARSSSRNILRESSGHRAVGAAVGAFDNLALHKPWKLTADKFFV